MQPSLDLLIFGAHPDDAEIGMGGTIAKHVKQGFKVGICDLTFAELSSNGTVEQRQKEAAQAGEILGLTMRSNLGLPDRGLDGSRAQLDAVTLEIRKHRPRYVFAPYWKDRHPDHVACSRLVQEAVFNAKLRNLLPGTEAWNVQECFFYFINDVAEPDLMVDISREYNVKQKALEAYRSQFVPEGTGTVPTPLNQGYLRQVEARDSMLGQRRTVPYAEGFVTRLPYMVDTF